MRILTFAFLTAFTLCLTLGASKPARACVSCEGYALQQVTVSQLDSFETIANEAVQTFSAEFLGLKNWWTAFWDFTITPALQGMADQLSATALYQTFLIGKFFDADAQLDAQRSLQIIRAQTHKAYQPSTGLCRFGSATKSLAASERKADLNMLVLRRRSQNRVLGNASAISSLGAAQDMTGRMQQFKEVYCDLSNNGGNLGSLCRHGDSAGGDDPNRLNKDIDYVRTFSSPWTLDVDFSDANVTDDETDLFALADNLYNNEIYPVHTALAQLPDNPFEEVSGRLDAPLRARATAYQDLRALLAKQSVAENSFNALASMKSAGTSGSKAYLDAVIQEIGFGSSMDLDALVGTQPSYYAQMEVLTKKLYQDPAFYTNLYDTPDNVLRKEVAMQAIGLMQKFDMLKSSLRGEMNIAVLLETLLEDEQVSLGN